MSWHRSLDASDASDIWDPSPSELQELERMYEKSFDESCPDTNVDASDEGRWRCIKCHSASWTVAMDRTYKCLDCSGTEFYDASQPHRRDTAEGTWTYVPAALSPTASQGSPSASLRPMTANPPGGPPMDDNTGDDERAESEVPTVDPIVDPYPLRPNRRQRRRLRNFDGLGSQLHPSERPDHSVSGTSSDQRRPAVQRASSLLPGSAHRRDAQNGELIQALRQLLSERKNRGDVSSEVSWNSAKGPSPGVRWRGGTAPAPPKWNYPSTDLRAFAKYERKVRTWQLQVKNYYTKAEAGLALFTSLQGEAEAEAEHLDLEKVNSATGVDYVLESLRGPLQQKQLLQKRKLLSDYESVARQPSESVRQYINRYRRIELDLQSIGIRTETMYDAESKGYRVLDRCKLSPDCQRLVLIGAGNTLDYEKVCESLCLQYPDFKPPPPIQGYAGPAWKSNRAGKGSGSSSSQFASPSSMSTAPSSASSSTSRSSNPKGFGKGFNGPKRAYVTENANGDADERQDGDLEQIPEEEEDEFADAQENEENDMPEEGNEIPPDDDQEDDIDLNELSQVLTVTARKLQSTILGRKFSGHGAQGKRSIQERKLNSTCAACGLPGHWHGDPICKLSAKGKGRGQGEKGRSTGKASTPSSSTSYHHNAKKALVVTYGDNTHETEDHDQGHQSYFNFPVCFPGVQEYCMVYQTECIDFGGYMIIDTACQRSCAGKAWLTTHQKILKTHRLTTREVHCHDEFLFGAGGTQLSTSRCYLPASFQGQETQGMLFGVNILDATIPFLASRTLLERLGCVLDLQQKTMWISMLEITVPLVMKHGHIAALITAFPPMIHTCTCWKELSHDNLWRDPDPELLLSEAILSRSDSQTATRSAHASRHPRAARMAYPVESYGDPCVAAGLELHALRAMSRLVKFKLRTRAWLTQTEHLEVAAEQLAEMTATPVASPLTCTHPVCRRYGNMHGSFSQCNRCLRRFRWNPEEQGWETLGDPRSQHSLPLPAPSSSTILPKAKATTSKSRAKARPKGSARTQHFNLDNIETDSGLMESYEMTQEQVDAILEAESMTGEAWMRADPAENE